MKFKRLVIRNYRGVEDRTVEFADSGTTLIQGPNEVGKTSLAEAVHVLFKYKASSNHQEVRDIKPVHRDVGSEIELEAESGPYHFVYRKHFHKAKSTELEIITPQPKNLTDDEAHEEANRILSETLDKKLWDALMIRQGDMIEQPVLSGRAALMKALDSAAGGEATDRHAESLFERVEAEYYSYYQRNGREGSGLSGASAALDAAWERVEETKTLLDELEAKSERCALLKRREIELQEDRLKKTAERKEQLLLVATIEALDRELSAARLGVESAGKVLLARERDSEERTRLRTVVQKAVQEVDRLKALLAENEPSLQEAEKRLEQSNERVKGAEEEKRCAEKALALARGDAQYLENVLNLEMMRERLGRVDAIRQRKRDALRELEQNLVDEKLLARINAAEMDAARLRARLEAEAPRVIIRGLGNTPVTVDGEERQIVAGDRIENPVAGHMRLTVPELLEVEVYAGGGLEHIEQTLETAIEQQEALYRQTGVASSSEAMAALERRRGAQAVLDDADRIERENLRDLTYDDFCDRMRILENAVAAYSSERAGDSPLPGTLDAARHLLPELETALANGTLSLSVEMEARAVHEKDWLRLDMERKETRIALTLTEKSLEQDQSALDISRQRLDDNTLEQALAAAQQAVIDAEKNVRVLEERLKEYNPDKVRALAAALTGSLESLETQLHDIQRELASLGTELSIRGEEGLFEQWQTASLDAEEKAQRLASLRSRAEAARLLYSAMREERDLARRAYLQPLKDKIEELGRVVWDPTFAVHMDEDDLSIDSRTLSGITVPFASLSGGAREQLALIFRAACAILVSKYEGMPLILDDALGYTDTDRLHLMGAVLSKAAQQCQIIILTCVPSRYSTIGPAKVIQLP